MILRWGGTNQALASIGTLASYPIHLVMHTADPLTWAAGGTYLAVVASMSVFGAALYASYVRSGLHLVHALSEREARLQSYFDLAPVGTAVLRADGTFSEVNDELCRLLGYTRDETRRARAGSSWPRPRTRLPRARRRKIALARHRRGRRPRAAGSSATTARRSTRRSTCAGLPGPRGTIDHVMVLVQDITDRKRMEEERERVLAARARRAPPGRGGEPREGRVPRDALARAPHAAQRRSSAGRDLLRRTRCRATGRDRARSRPIERNARAQAQLIDDLLDVSRIVSGKLRLELRAGRRSATVVDAAVDVDAARRPTRRASRSSTRRSPRPCQVIAATPTGCSRSCGTCSRTR